MSAPTRPRDLEVERLVDAIAGPVLRDDHKLFVRRGSMRYNVRHAIEAGRALGKADGACAEREACLAIVFPHGRPIGAAFDINSGALPDGWHMLRGRLHEQCRIFNAIRARRSGVGHDVDGGEQGRDDEQHERAGQNQAEPDAPPEQGTTAPPTRG